MSNSEVVLTDVAKDLWHETFSFDGSNGVHIDKRTLHGGRSEGIDVVSIDNGRLRVDILPTRGMGIWRGSLDDLFLGWDSPIEQPVNPAFVELNDWDGLGWLQGFNELLCRCGLAWNGPPGVDGDMPITLHGRIANRPAHRVVVAESEGRLSVTGEVDERMLFNTNLRLTSTVETTGGANSVTIRDRITNLGGQSAESQMLYHINIGRPVLEAGARAVVPATEVAARDVRAEEGLSEWANYCGPEPGYAEQAYFIRPATGNSGKTLALLINATRDAAFAVRFDANQLPCFTQWKNTAAVADGYVTGLEPGTNYPNPKSFERAQDRVINLQPGESYEIELELVAANTPNEVEALQSEADSVQGTQPPQLLNVESAADRGIAQV